MHGWCVPSLCRRRRTREPKAGKRGRGRRSGEEAAVMGGIKPRGGNNGKEVARSCSRHPACIVVAVPVYGVMSKYWCCWQSTESGLFFVSPKEETSRNPAIGGAYGLWQARDPCAIRRAIRPCPIPCHLTPRPGHRTTTRFKRQPAAPIHAHHSIAKDSDHNAGNGETKQ